MFQGEFETLRTLIELKLLSQPATDTSPRSLSMVIYEHSQGNIQLYTVLARKQSGSHAVTHLQSYLSTLLRVHLQQQITPKSQPAVPPEILAH